MSWPPTDSADAREQRERDREHDREDRQRRAARILAGMAPRPAPAGSTHPPTARPIVQPPAPGAADTATLADRLCMLLGIDSGEADAPTILAALDEALAERWTDQDQQAAASDRMTLIETDVYDQLRAADRAGRETREQLLTAERDRLIAAAISDGRTTAARRDHWENSWAADPDRTRALLASLASGLDPSIAAELEQAQEPSVDEYTALYGDTDQER